MNVFDWDSNKINLDPVENRNQMHLGAETNYLVGVKDVGETGCVPYPSSLIS